MHILTKAQIAKIKAIYDRHAIQNRFGLTYRQFRKTVFHTIGCDGAIVIPASGMYICVERDGYWHT